ncbi:MAG: hypothetical protein V5B36_03220 [Candidatus Accumulibacter sp. UW25]|jgi:uncharacterized Zn-finger protein
MIQESFFREGGEMKTTRIGRDQYQMTVSIPPDAEGRIARECHAENCSPAYFKVKSGTGLIDQQNAFCPYCHHEDEPQAFASSEQLRYAKDIVLREAHQGVARMLKNALGLDASGRKAITSGLISIEMSLKDSQKPHVFRPVEDEVRRDVVCPHCGLDQSVYGLATWCADCGKDIFLTHVEAECSVIRIILSDVDRRREALGPRIAARDIENCLEDTVSIFEAVLRILVRRHLVLQGTSILAIDKFFRKTGNAFQNLERSAEIFKQELQISLLDCLTNEESRMLGDAFNKRHPITHNLGVVDRKYLERALSAEDEGKEVLVSQEEVLAAVAISMKVFRSVHTGLFEAS